MGIEQKIAQVPDLTDPDEYDSTPLPAPHDPWAYTADEFERNVEALDAIYPGYSGELDDRGNWIAPDGSKIDAANNDEVMRIKNATDLLKYGAPHPLPVPQIGDGTPGNPMVLPEMKFHTGRNQPAFQEETIIGSNGEPQTLMRMLDPIKLGYRDRPAPKRPKTTKKPKKGQVKLKIGTPVIRD